MTQLALYEVLKARFGESGDPDAWSPLYFGVSVPLEFERVISKMFVQCGNWSPVRAPMDGLKALRILTASALAEASEQILMDCVTSTGLRAMKAKRLKTIGSRFTKRYGTEVGFCEEVTREEILDVPGIGPETAAPIPPYARGRRSWPVGTYCFRITAKFGLIPREPTAAAENRRIQTGTTSMVASQLPNQVADWQRLHALMQLERVRLRQPLLLNRPEVVTGESE